MHIHHSTLEQIALANGLELIGVFSLEQVRALLKKQKDYLESWQQQGYAAEMDYMKRSSKLFTDVSKLLPEVRSVLCFSLNYYQGAVEQETPWGYGRVARYAWGRDYHRVIKKRLDKFVNNLQAEIKEDISWRRFTDAVPLLERAIAAGSHLGFIGKNTMFIRPGVGSFTFVAEILLDVEVEGQQQAQEKLFSCGACQRCLVNCPTNAFVEPKVLDSRKCISYLTIEKKTEFSSWEREAIGSWIFGCDVCQDVCPFNHSSIEEGFLGVFDQSKGAGLFLDLIGVLKITSQEEYLARFAGTALMRAGRECLIRNACCVVENTAYVPAYSELIRISREEGSELLRSQAKKCLVNLLNHADGLDKQRIENSIVSFSK